MIFIPGAVPSSKNSRIWTGRYSIASKATSKYVKESKSHYLEFKDDFKQMLEGLDKPYMIGMHFVRKTHHRWDFNNATQVVQDLMSDYEWLEDDNTDIMYPVPFMIDGVYYTYDKKQPGVYLKVIREYGI